MKAEAGADRVADVEFDQVDVASKESFPASDAPAWATGRARPEAPEEGLGRSPSASSRMERTSCCVGDREQEDGASLL